MKINLTATQLLDAAPALQKLATMLFPAAVSLRISRTIQKLNPEIVNIDGERTKLFKKYGGEVKGNTITVTARLDELQAELKPFLETKLSIDCEPLEHWYFDGKELTPADMIALGPLFKSEEKPKKEKK